MRGVVCGCVCHTPTNNRRGIVWLAINRLARPSGSRPTIGLEPACNVSLVNNRETCSRYPRLLPEQVALSSTLCSFSRLEGFTDIDIKLRASPVLPGRGRNLAARAQHPRAAGCSNNRGCWSTWCLWIARLPAWQCHNERSTIGLLRFLCMLSASLPSSPSLFRLRSTSPPRACPYGR